MINILENTQDFTFCFNEEPENNIESSRYEFKFLDSSNYLNYGIEKIEDNVFDCQAKQRQTKFTYESTSSEQGEADFQMDDMAPIKVSFTDNFPNLFELEQIVCDQIKQKGYNSAVLDCLDISTKEESDDESHDIIRKKQKKSRNQICSLKAEYKRRPNWNKRSMKKLAKDLSLSLSQVYKWHWDQINKEKATQSDTSSESHKRAKTC
jgi:hypothetical protein